MLQYMLGQMNIFQNKLTYTHTNTNKALILAQNNKAILNNNKESHSEPKEQLCIHSEG